ncbi:MAG TPA: class I SAM-dependent methyltransferase [Firmicutes bacterium]|nr:class I SAM-dependent methyltransferase [Bacillota bacterium]
MKQNAYDQDIFFEKYSQMERSVKGLEGAGEWHALKKMLPDFTGKRVLDLGCGFGWHCRYAAEHGAKEVIGLDPSQKMLERAAKCNAAPVIRYIQTMMEEYTYPKQAFDIVISSLALHYVESFDEICQKVAGTLTRGGIFVFSVEHPVFTAQGPQQWLYDPDGRICCWPVDRYFDEGEREAIFLGEPIRKYHRTLTTYWNGLVQNGLTVTDIVEPEPPSEMLSIPGMADELRRPMMLLISACKMQEI